MKKRDKAAHALTGASHMLESAAHLTLFGEDDRVEQMVADAKEMLGMFAQFIVDAEIEELA